ncbi:diguanylate cyclase/phosphodiesterase (GGDEF & EAL domains) with PAS/PAC sensor(s) [Desulfosporosinus sp. I2]|uniref:HD domain-containing phosphohydrolase n=1 Tax=Desulfosporosinus sp. I2 TaxID=1617025 RepID=UPI00061FA791|nr:HD domain-containing phosphohydrolase [Desulfosporosinus sp. I2]KJR46104.1 diguanylate cyclase/phosphodiesterase (GGDEF & EAL domains) with PAS/PAC sensor(s) [Desulfosporosinus sp. I2]
MRNKITIISIVITFAFILLSNVVFSRFFSNYLENQEDAQINSSNKSAESFFYEKTMKYQGTVNDYSHWDDSYNFINDINTQQYTASNLIEDTFSNIEVNFIFFVKEDNSIWYQQYYDDIKKQFTAFPKNLPEDIEKLMRNSNPKEDVSKIIKLENQFYFIATSEITDSSKEKNSNGRMVMGRLIDESMIKNLNEITDSKIKLSTIDNVDNDAVTLNKGKDTVQAEFIIPNTAYEGSSILMTLTKTRNLFIGGMNQVYNFMLFYSIIMVVILLIIFYLLGKYISRPFIKLINEVKGLDLTKNEILKLEINGNDEFSFLRNSVNHMLRRIETEQYKVRENEEKLYATLTSVGDGVIAVDRNGIVDFMNPVAQWLTGWSTEEGNGKSFETVFNIINEYSREKIESPVQKVFETEEIIELANHTILISRDGTERAIEDTAAPIKDAFGKVIGVVLVFRDFSDKKEKRRQIEYLSYHDQLTGLYNRRFFEEELKRLDTRRNLPLSFVFADVNGLKTINDAFGHQVGDQLIKQVSDVFKTICRADDIISRTGGDEFVILLPKTEAAFVKELVKRLKEKIEQKKIMDIDISVSFGCDTKIRENQCAQEVLKNAEDLMYQKKIFDSSSKRSAVITSILNTLHLKSPREEAHSKRVSLICEDIGKAYHLNDDEIKELKIAGELHDIGKIAIDEVILNKPGKLSEAEWAQIQHHPETGYRLLGTSSEYYNISEYVLAHHERWDGMGYPKGLKGEAIHWKARIITLADAYDAMTCERPYRKALSEEQAVAELKKNAGIQFDPDIAKVFVEKILGLTW